MGISFAYRGIQFLRTLVDGESLQVPAQTFFREDQINGRALGLVRIATVFK